MVGQATWLYTVCEYCLSMVPDGVAVLFHILLALWFAFTVGGVVSVLVSILRKFLVIR